MKLNKRLTLYEEIKASIRERGLDSASAITRHLGRTHCTIRNSGNTSLVILREFLNTDGYPVPQPHINCKLIFALDARPSNAK